VHSIHTSNLYELQNILTFFQLHNTELTTLWGYASLFPDLQG